jgi:hypothetical protein
MLRSRVRRRGRVAIGGSPGVALDRVLTSLSTVFCHGSLVISSDKGNEFLAEKGNTRIG